MAPDESLYTKLASSFSWSFLSRVIAYFFAFILSVFLARLLGDTIYGTFVFIFSLVGFFLIFADFGIHTSLLKHLGYARSIEKNCIRRLLTFTFFLKLSLASVFALLFYFFAPFLSDFFNKPDALIPLRIAALLLFLTTMAEFLATLFRSFMVFKYESFFLFTQNFLKVLFLVFLYFNVLSLFSVILGFSIAIFLSLLIFTLVFFLKIYKGLPPPVEASSLKRKLVSYSLPLALISFTYYVYYQSDVLILAYYLPSKYIAYYAIAQKIILAAIIPLTAFRFVLEPLLAYYSANKEKYFSKLSAIYNQGLSLSFVYTLPLFVLFFFFAQQLISFLYGATYLQAGIFLTALAIYAVPLGAGIVGSSFLIAGDFAPLVAKLTTFTAISNIILNLILIPFWGVYGAIISTLVTHSLHIFLAILFTKRRFHLSLEKQTVRTIIKLLGINFLAFIIIYSMRSYFHNLLFIIILLFVYFLVYILLLTKFNIIDLKKLLTLYAKK